MALALLLALAPAAADFDNAMGHLKSGKYLEAAGEFQALVDEHPDYADGYHLLGVCLLKAEKFKEAEKNLLKAIELDGDKFDYHYNLANAYRAQGRNDKVVQVLNSAEGLAADKQKYLVYQVRGNALAAQKKWAEAIGDLEKAVAAKPDANTQAQLGKAYFSEGDSARAVTALRKAIALQKSPSTHDLLVEAMIDVAAKTPGDAAKKAKYAEAMAEAEKFQQAHPTAEQAKYLIGRTALGAGQFDKAIAAFQSVLAARPAHCNAMTNLGKTYMAKQDWGKALSTFEGATKCDAKLGLAWESMGFVLQKTASGSKDYAIQQQNYARAISAYEKAQAIKPSAGLTDAIASCKQNLAISSENQTMSQTEAQQAAAALAEEARIAEEERKRKEWEAKQKDN